MSLTPDEVEYCKEVAKALHKCFLKYKRRGIGEFNILESGLIFFLNGILRKLPPEKAALMTLRIYNSCLTAIYDLKEDD